VDDDDAVVLLFVAVNPVCASRRERAKRRCGACGVPSRGRMVVTDVGVEVAALSWVHSDDIPEQQQPSMLERRAASAAFVREEEEEDGGGGHENRRRGRRFPPFCSNRTLPSIRLTSPSLQFMNSTATCYSVYKFVMAAYCFLASFSPSRQHQSHGHIACPSSPKILKGATSNVSLTRM